MMKDLPISSTLSWDRFVDDDTWQTYLAQVDPNKSFRQNIVDGCTEYLCLCGGVETATGSLGNNGVGVGVGQDVAAFVRDHMAKEDLTVHVNGIVVPNKKDLYALAARTLCYNSINFSFYPDEGESRWYIINVHGEAIGQDDEANAILASLERTEQRLRGDEFWLPVAYVGTASFDRYFEPIHGPTETHPSDDSDGCAVRCRLITDDELTLTPTPHPHIWADGDFLSAITSTFLSDYILDPAPQAGALPLANLRAACLRSVGDAYRRQPSFLQTLLDTSDSGTFCRKLCTAVSCFRDLRSYVVNRNVDCEGPSTLRFLEFAKRAQLCCSMYISNGLVDHASGGGDSLTVFSDYRIPQFFVHYNLFFPRYPLFQERLHRKFGIGDDKKTDSIVAFNSAEELLLRCGTVICAEEIMKCYNYTYNKCGIVKNLDFFLWKSTVELVTRNVIQVPFHKTRTFCY